MLVAFFMGVIMKDDLKLIKKILQNQNGIALLAITSLVSSLVSLTPMFFIARAVDRISSNNNLELNNTVLFVLFFFLASLLSILIRNALGYLSSNYISKVVFDIRQKIFRFLTSASSYFNVNIDSGEKIYRVLNDTKNIDYVISQPLTTSAADIMDIIWISVIMWILSPWLVLSSWVMLPLLFYGSWKISNVQAILQGKLQESETCLLQKSKRTFDNLLRVILLKGVDRENEKFLSEMQRGLKNNMNINFNLSKIFVYEGAISHIGILILIGTSFILFSFKEISIGDVVYIISLSSRFFAPIRSIVRYLPTFHMGMVSIRRIGKFLEGIDVEKPRENTIHNIGYIKQISVNNPSIIYNTANGFKLVLTFTLHAGKVIYIRGKNGMGKTSLLRAIQGISQGKIDGIYYDGLKSDEVTFNKKLNSVIYFSSQFRLLEDKLINEVNYPNTKCNETNKSSLFNLDNLYDNYNERKLSDGERLKVLLSNLNNNVRKFVLLDEPFINLDKQSQTNLHRWITTLKAQGVGILIISHELDAVSKNYVDEFYHI